MLLERDQFIHIFLLPLGGKRKKLPYLIRQRTITFLFMLTRIVLIRV